jgi:hypothetical protein
LHLVYYVYFCCLIFFLLIFLWQLLFFFFFFFFLRVCYVPNLKPDAGDTNTKETFLVLAPWGSQSTGESMEVNNHRSCGLGAVRAPRKDAETCTQKELSQGKRRNQLVCPLQPLTPSTEIRFLHSIPHQLSEGLKLLSPFQASNCDLSFPDHKRVIPALSNPEIGHCKASACPQSLC